MATTMMTEEDKKRQRNSSFPANPVPSGVVYKGGIVKNAAQSLASGFSPTPSLSAPWWSRDYAAAANMSNKSGLELERDRVAAAPASSLPVDDPIKRLASIGTLSMGERGASLEQASKNPASQQMQSLPTARPDENYGNEGRNYPRLGMLKPQYVGMPAVSSDPTKQASKPSEVHPDASTQPPPGARPMMAGRVPVTMPKLVNGPGMFASMANFVNQASDAYGQIAKNKQATALNRDEISRFRSGLEADRAQEDAMTADVARQGARLGMTSQKRMNDLQAQYLAAPDDATRAKISQTIAALTGKTKDRNLKDEFAIVGGGSRYDPNTGTFVPEGQVLVDLNTRQVVPTGQSAPVKSTEPSRPMTREAYMALPKGAAYIDPNDGVTKTKQ